MGQGFQLDVLNLTGQSIYITCSITSQNSSSNLYFNAGGITLTSLQSGQLLSQANSQKAPQYFEMNSGMGSAPAAIYLGASEGAMTPILIEFDTTSTQAFNGVVYLMSTGVVLANGQTVCPAIYLTTWGQWTEAILVLLIKS